MLGLRRTLLTKSKYLNGLQCIKLLWISCHAPEKLKPNELQSFIFNQGHTVGDAARQLFPEGVLVESSLPFIEKINLTKDLIKQKKIIFEGSFLFNQCFCMVDILIPCNDGWELIEVKSSSSLKKVHIDDVSFQVYLLTSLGVNVTKKSVYFINTSYSLNNELSLCGKNLIKNDNVLDTLEIARNKFPGSSNSLDALCKRYRIDNSKRTKHTAIIDCELLFKVYVNLIGQKEPSLNFTNYQEKSNLNGMLNNNYSKKIVKPSIEEEKMHKEFLKKYLKKNFF